jgi:hypothetical protein
VGATPASGMSWRSPLKQRRKILFAGTRVNHSLRMRTKRQKSNAWMSMICH